MLGYFHMLIVGIFLGLINDHSGAIVVPGEVVENHCFRFKLRIFIMLLQNTFFLSQFPRKIELQTVFKPSNQYQVSQLNDFLKKVSNVLFS